jgi:hypothetical protein
MNSTNLPNNLNVIQKPKPYDYNYTISMSYRLNGTETFLKLPINKSYGKIKYAKVVGYRYYSNSVFNAVNQCHVHIANNENPLYMSSAYSANDSLNNCNFVINYGVFDGSTIPITITGFDANYFIELLINYYY